MSLNVQKLGFQAAGPTQSAGGRTSAGFGQGAAASNSQEFDLTRPNVANGSARSFGGFSQVANQMDFSA